MTIPLVLFATQVYKVKKWLLVQIVFIIQNLSQEIWDTVPTKYEDVVLFVLRGLREITVRSLHSGVSFLDHMKIVPCAGAEAVTDNHHQRLILSCRKTGINCYKKILMDYYGSKKWLMLR